MTKEYRAKGYSAKRARIIGNDTAADVYRGKMKRRGF